MNWLIAVCVIGVLLIAGCAMWINAASDTADEFMDFAARAACYDTGYQDGVYENKQLPPYNDDPCVRLYSDGYEDGRSGEYDPPED